MLVGVEGLNTHAQKVDMHTIPERGLAIITSLGQRCWWHWRTDIDHCQHP